MEYIEGDNLDQVWMDLPEEEKADLASKVADNAYNEDKNGL